MKFNFFILLFVYLIKIYQYFISPLIGQNCRYLPTCSEYSIQSLKQHGIIKGALYSIKRISRCHPLGGHGFDPVPKNKNEKII